MTTPGGLIFFVARMAQTGSETFGNTPLVYLGEISYSVYMVCVPWKIVFVNAAAKLFELSDERLPLWLWLVFLGGVIPLAAARDHLIAKPCRTAMKGWADSQDGRRPSTAGA